MLRANKMSVRPTQVHRAHRVGGALGIFPHQLSWLINNPLRRLIIAPQTLAMRLPLRESDRVLEIGPGSGYFSAALASRIPQGRLELFDVQPEMLAKAQRRLQAQGLRNVGYTAGDAGEVLPFRDSDFDIAVLVSVLGEIPNQHRCLDSLFRVLRPSGTLAFHEAIPDPDRIPFEALRTLAEGHGFRFHQRWGRSWNYTATFVKSGISV
jgi:ubiquinone/menaquinone biosynthesis C-methylase UbiE